MITSCQRIALLRVSSAYRTVSAAAIQVVRGVAPIALLAQERARLYHRGHDTFENYKVRISKTETPNCPYCGTDDSLNTQYTTSDDGRGKDG
ncbi:hypothetical protein JTB14_010056 [Gonioctena quinquepunctata]|nr:hypothetical protein JTB14_010056 [Gonioctena quinquepunctata]